ncbi:hypothetical protein NUSPORA_01238 [Nucleospora cyclopteri]
MPPVPEKISIKHLQNITKAAKSLCDGNFMYETCMRFSAESEPAVKASKKKAKIIAENERRKAEEKRKADNLWLGNFFTNYQRLRSLREKRLMVESIKVNNEYINKRLRLLKIELYADLWNVEAKAEIPNEYKLVPLYMECINFIHSYNKEITKEESLFVLNHLVNANFAATAQELIEKFHLPTDQPVGNSKPCDIDLYFQLKYTGEFLKRSLGTKPDKRVPFDPDAWQVKLLDAVDANKSVVISAPTSSGKTFICYYVVEKILKENISTKSGGIIPVVDSKNLPFKVNSTIKTVVFCLPTKALANQVSADIYARFRPQKNMNLQGTLMQDRSSEPFNCQVLITIPSMLEIVLNNNIGQISYIVIDEVHKINDEQLGLPIERVIHQATCPILLLSATIGNVNSFYEWFRLVENSKGRMCELVIHKERYCETRTYVYNRKDEKSITLGVFEDVVTKGKLIPLNCMFAYTHSHLKDFGFGDDLQFLPEELLNIYYYIYMVLPEKNKRLIKKLAPRKFFTSNIISKSDVKKYERHLLGTFQDWVQHQILSETEVKQVYDLLTEEAADAFEADYGEKYVTEILFDLTNNLSESDLLPAIVFNTDRDKVTEYARSLYKKIQQLDRVTQLDKTQERLRKDQKRQRDAKPGKDAWIEESQAEIYEEEIQRFNYLSDSKLTEYEVRMELKDAPSYILEMALRGIGLHHDALGRKVKSAMEILFRKKHIRILFATETLALGINMPCRTVVFLGDSLELDPMNYKQMSGRAGRRGFDTLGNVVFVGIPKNRVQNLLVSMLPQVKGAYPFSNTSLINFKIEKSLIRNSLMEINTKNSTIIEDLKNISIKSDNRKGLDNRKELDKEVMDNGKEVDNYNRKEVDKEAMNKEVENTRQEVMDKEVMNNGKELDKEVMDKEVMNNMIPSIDGNSLIQFQKSTYSFMYPSNWLYDLFITNRTADPGIFLFCLLLDKQLVSFEEKQFILLISHLFETIPSIDAKISLNKLDGMTYAFIQRVNEQYKKDLERVVYKDRPMLRALSRISNYPLHLINSLLYFVDVPKNSYIYDFYFHGSAARAKNVNMINGGELWKRLFNINVLLMNLLKVLEKNFGVDDERYKLLKVIYERFEEKYKAIFA